MPQGKGTYGSKVGRPSKKKYQAGGVVGMGEVAQLEAAQMGQELGSIPLQRVEPEIAISNAQERSEVLPDLTEYNQGGKVENKKDLWYDIIKPTVKKAAKQVAKDVKAAAKGSVEHRTAKSERYLKKSKKAKPADYEHPLTAEEKESTFMHRGAPVSAKASGREGKRRKK